jgi:hypothetical protein
MSIQAITGPRSLIALGVGAGDLATLYSLGQRVGNWLTAASGDEYLLKFLEQDEMDLFRRRGLIDIGAFNKRWGKSIRLLVNGAPQTLSGEHAEKALGRLPRVTSIFITIMATLLALASETVTKDILRKLLLKVIRTTDFNEETLRAQLTARINAWRSCATVRGLSSAARALRASLIQKKLILDGLMPSGDSYQMVEFLCWPLTDNSEVYQTSSSDVAASAYCLSRLGIDVLSVSGLGQDDLETSCQLRYMPKSIFSDRQLKSTYGASLLYLGREVLTTVSLLQPEESLTLFPIDYETAGRCREAWKAGSMAAKYIRVAVVIPQRGEVEPGRDLRYQLVDLGTEIRERVTNLGTLADKYGLAFNQELVNRLESILSRESSQTIDWLQALANNFLDFEEHISSKEMQNGERVNAFTIFQAFIMGYYYSVILPMVDTSTLEVPTVDGSWGFRSDWLLSRLRTWSERVKRDSPSESQFTRQEFIDMISELLMGSPVKSKQVGEEKLCMGYVGKRALLANSLVQRCSSIDDIGKFILLDVDIGGIPRNVDGWVRPGIAEGLPTEHIKRSIGRAVRQRGPPEDLTLHIEPDWEGNPETFVQCARYKGRRIATINPALADLYFCLAFTEPVEEPSEDQVIANAVECTLEDFLAERIVPPTGQDTCVLVQAYGKPCMRYAATAFYEDFKIAVASNCIATALANSPDRIVVAGDGIRYTKEEMAVFALRSSIAKIQKIQNCRVVRIHHTCGGP